MAVVLRSKCALQGRRRARCRSAYSLRAKRHGRVCLGEGRSITASASVPRFHNAQTEVLCDRSGVVGKKVVALSCGGKEHAAPSFKLERPSLLAIPVRKPTNSTAFFITNKDRRGQILRQLGNPTADAAVVTTWYTQHMRRQMVVLDYRRRTAIYVKSE
jgi:hypothetical protein